MLFYKTEPRASVLLPGPLDPFQTVWEDSSLESLERGSF